MANYYTYSLRGTNEPPCLTDYRLFYYNYIVDTAALTIYEEKDNVDIVIKRRLPKYYVIVEDETTYETFFVRIGVADNRRKAEPFDRKEMLEHIVSLSKTYVGMKRYNKKRLADKSAPWNFIKQNYV